MSKTAVILFNLGGPDSKESIEPFLYNFFMDPNIIRLPKPARWVLAKGISYARSRNEAGSSYAALGNKSPLLENSQAQAQALEAVLGPGFKVFVCMRYWHPMADDIARQVTDWGTDKVFLLPLYPQFSTTTTRSSLGVWRRAARQAGLRAPESLLCCYPENDGFIRASARSIGRALAQADEAGFGNPRVLFSAHGLPESVIRDGDPYQWQCKKTAAAIAHLMGLAPEDWLVSYQSRVGRQKWIGPATEDEIRRAGREKRALVIYPHAFTQEHVETLVELDIEYRHVAEECGVPGYFRAATVSTDPDFIDGLAKLVRNHSDSGRTTGEGGACLCPQEFKRCCMRSLA